MGASESGGRLPRATCSSAACGREWWFFSPAVPSACRIRLRPLSPQRASGSHGPLPSRRQASSSATPAVATMRAESTSCRLTKPTPLTTIKRTMHPGNSSKACPSRHPFIGRRWNTFGVQWSAAGSFTTKATKNVAAGLKLTTSSVQRSDRWQAHLETASAAAVKTWERSFPYSAPALWQLTRS